MVDAADSLPLEIIEDILIRLPTKSIIRFKQVSKPWLKLITGRRFVKRHFITNQEGFVAIFNIARPLLSEERDRRFLVTCLRNDHHHEGTEETEPVVNFGFELTPGKTRSSLQLIGHCNGVMCLFIDSTAVMLVNPSLKEVKTLPISPFEDSTPSFQDSTPPFQLIGLGFDNSNLDFKVVRITGLLDERNAVGERYQRPRSRAEVYNLMSNVWRQLTHFPLVTDHPSSATSIFVNGAVHWCARIDHLDWRVLTFDMTTEAFDQIGLPQDWNGDGDGDVVCVPALFAFNQESLCFVTYCSHPNHHVVSIWRMDKPETQVAWSKLYTVGPLPGLVKPIGFLKEMEFLYNPSDPTDRSLILHDVLNQSSSVICEDVSHLKPGHVLESHSWLMGLCRPTLASIRM